MYFGGELNGIRILKSDTVSLMESDQPLVAESRYGLSTVRMKQFDRGTWFGHQGRYSGLSSNVYYQGTNQKNYYGYDERHNLEDTIDNHAYFESIHSKRNANNNLAIDKVI